MLTACSEVRFIYHYSVILQHCIQIEEASYNSGLVASKKMINSDSESQLLILGIWSRLFPMYAQIYIIMH